MIHGVSNRLTGPIIVRLASDNKTEEGRSTQDFRFVVCLLLNESLTCQQGTTGNMVKIWQGEECWHQDNRPWNA